MVFYIGFILWFHVLVSLLAMAFSKASDKTSEIVLRLIILTAETIAALLFSFKLFH